MKDSIQNKINKIQQIALASNLKKSKVYAQDNLENNDNDNLSRSIRNEKEAALFFSELKSVIDLTNRNAKRNGNIVFSNKNYISIQETHHLLSTIENRKRLLESIEQMEKGNLKSYNLEDL